MSNYVNAFIFYKIYYKNYIIPLYIFYVSIYTYYIYYLIILIEYTSQYSLYFTFSFSFLIQGVSLSGLSVAKKSSCSLPQEFFKTL